MIFVKISGDSLSAVPLCPQAHRGPLALLDSGALQETLMWAPKDQSDSLGHVAHRGLKESLAPRDVMEFRVKCQPELKR